MTNAEKDEKARIATEKPFAIMMGEDYDPTHPGQANFCWMPKPMEYFSARALDYHLAYGAHFIDDAAQQLWNRIESARLL